MIKHDYSVSIKRVNLISLIVALPLFMICIAIFIALWGWELLDIGIDLLLHYPITVASIFISGIIAHELLHGLTWQWLSGEHNSVKYGMMWKSLTPYVHITRPISISSYMTGTIMPVLVTGFLPLVMAYMMASSALLMFGLIFTWGATGDMVVIWKLRNIDISATVEDHPSRAGAYVYESTDTEQTID